MAILGSIIKGALQLRDRLDNDTRTPAEMQEAELRTLLERAQDTAFGQHYGFADLLTDPDPVSAYAARVPMHDYDKIHDEWWFRALNGGEDITWPGKVEFFAKSSGTSGSPSKYLPVTDDMRASIRSAGIKQVLGMANFDLPADFFEKEILMLGSSIDLKEKENYAVGEISGISASHLPSWFEGYYRPGREIAAIREWNDRVQRIAEEAPNWDVGALSGIPTWIRLMLERIVEHNKLKTIHDIWPNLTIYATGGVPFAPYRRSFEKMLARPLVYVDTYLASEGFLAYQNRPNDQMAMRLNLDDGVYFEFIPFNVDTFTADGKPTEAAAAVPLREVEEGAEYALLISTCSGNWRYLIGDTIRFTDLVRGEIVITGRTKHFLDVGKAHFTVDRMTRAVEHVEKTFEAEIQEFTLAVDEGEGGDVHHWYLGSDEPLDHQPLLEALEAGLREAVPHYDDARGQVADVRVDVLGPEVFYRWLELNKKRGGQIKMPRLLRDEQLADWRTFISRKPVS
ncbi:MAG: GH3 auxin-responsive promoter family protein [Catalinimonas sp.]